MSLMSVISIEGITKQYGTNIAVDDLSLVLDEGDIFGFLGPNGAGKTTAIRVLLGFLRAGQGRATVLGMDTWDDRHKIHEKVGYISGDLRMYKWMTLKSALDIFGKVRKRPITAKGLELADLLALDPSVPVRAMSRGMRQKVGLILALAHEPSVMIMDEPTTALDPPMKKTLFGYLRERAEQGNTVFFSSHSLSEVEDLCDSVAFLRDGKLVEHETLENLTNRARKHVTVQYSDSQSATLNHAPSCVEDVHRTENGWEGILCGDVKEFLRWSSQQSLADVIISPPDLDRLFHTYYHAGGSGI
ncbi:MAG TPA: ABC transporter ATP-binding protein [Candidatus Hydrogenedentes bacterium]|nr:ABC transporter ATP-binding protein [Candidatus Hydrogenedentota bacterium]